MRRLFWMLLTVQSAWIALSDTNFKPYHVSKKSIITFAPKLTENAYFGYSVSSLNVKNKSRVVASAPREGRVGKLFDCDIDTGNCTAIPDPEYLVTKANDIKTQYKDHKFWLGATVKSVGNEAFVTCAPLSLRTTLCNATAESGSSYATYGQCFKYINEEKSFTQLNEITLDDRKEAYEFPSLEQCMDTFGWSVDISRYGKLMVGGPAMTAGRAMLYDEDMLNTNPKLLIKYIELYQKKVDFNFGYSIAYGNFFTDHPTVYSAVSTVYGEKGMGKILFFSGNRYISKMLEDPSDQLGSLFGAALCAAKLKPGSPRAYLLVGAPGYTNKTWSDYNRGAVHVYVPNKRNGKSLIYHRKIIGFKINGFFGSTIANAGDLDGDGSDELAVAAPFEDNGRGAVYIYRGYELIQTNEEIYPKQRIQPAGFHAFGFSLSTLNDYEDTGCKKLIVGAPGSMVQGADQVAVVRCMPWISVILRNVYPKLQNRTNDTYFDFDSCLDVTYPKNLRKINTTITVSVNIVHPDAILANNLNKLKYDVQITKKESEFCTLIKVLTPVNGEYDKKIGIEITAYQAENPLDKEDFDPSYAVLCDSSKLHVYDTKFVGNCSSEICVPNLDAKLNSTLFSISDYTIGSTEWESFRIHVKNTGEVAYSACLIIGVLGVPIKSIPAYCEDGCNGQSQCGRVRCRPKSRLLSNDPWDIDGIVLETSTLDSADESVIVEVFVLNDCSNDNDTKLTDRKSIQLKSNLTGVFVHGKTNGGEVVEIKKSEVEETGAYFEHLYTVSNVGPTDLAEVKYKLSIKKYENYQYQAPKVEKDLTDTDCEPQITMEKDVFVAFCEVDGLKKGQKLEFLLPIRLSPGKWFDVLKKEDIIIESHLDLLTNLTAHMAWNTSVSTKLRKSEGGVPWWVILLAVIIGVVLLCIALYYLNKSGHLKRKNKESLKELKREIRRQSMRRSVRESSGPKNEFSDTNTLYDTKEQAEIENEIDIQEVQNDVDQSHGQTLVDVHAESRKKGVEHTNM